MSKEKPKFHKYPLWAPRFWHGLRFGDWISLLAENGFRVHPFRYNVAAGVSFFTGGNSLLRLAQNGIYGRKIRETEVSEPPVFIVGHWRSGTTYLHELMSLDERYAYPTTYQCFAPHHFLLTQSAMVKFGSWLLPNKRPMDNVSAGWNLPQEDEFAICNLGAPTPYRRIAFPNRPSPYMELLNMEDVQPKVMQAWKEAMEGFVKMLTFHYKKPLIMKSPPHTGRLKVLSELFPGAKFIHISRNPYTIFSSTRRLWQSLDEIQGLQVPNNKHLDEYVFEAFERMYSTFEQQRSELPDGTYVDVRYEDLVENPLEQLENAYTTLNLGNFDQLKETFEANIKSREGYKTNKFELPDEMKSQIRQRWSRYFELFGYE